MSGKYDCEDCSGTGRDEAKTIVMRKRECDHIPYVRCWTCNGNGLDPAKFFRWSEK